MPAPKDKFVCWDIARCPAPTELPDVEHLRNRFVVMGPAATTRASTFKPTANTVGPAETLAPMATSAYKVNASFPVHRTLPNVAFLDKKFAALEVVATIAASTPKSTLNTAVDATKTAQQDKHASKAFASLLALQRNGSVGPNV